MSRGHYVLSIHFRRAINEYEDARAEGAFGEISRAEQEKILTDTAAAVMDKTDLDTVREAVEIFLDDMYMPPKKTEIEK
jgi:hypothetical protein